MQGKNKYIQLACYEIGYQQETIHKRHAYLETIEQIVTYITSKNKLMESLPPLSSYLVQYDFLKLH